MKRLVIVCLLSVLAFSANAQSTGKPVVYVDVRAQGPIASTKGYPLDEQTVRLQVGQALSTRGYNWQPTDNLPTGDVTLLNVDFVVDESLENDQHLIFVSTALHMLETVKVGPARQVTLSLQDGLFHKKLFGESLDEARVKLRIDFAKELTSLINAMLNNYEREVLFGG